MAASDWAIVVGINDYPELGSLNGPENDARDFHQWVLTGGEVPAARARLICSSDFKPPAFESYIDAKPTMEAISKEFQRLDLEAQKSENAQLGRTVGRRLYLYFSGHGFGPDLEDAALLMANATRVATGFHIPGRPWANWFLRAGYFQEVVLLMDCCRENYPRSPLNVPAFISLTAPDVDRSKRFYGFSAKWGKLSRERTIDGKVHGVFTAALLAALSGGAATPTGDITAFSLGSFLFNSMRKFLDPADLANEDIAQEPDLDYDPNTGASFVIARVPPKTFPVTIRVSPPNVGQSLRVFDGKFALLQDTAAAASQVLDLARGIYLCVIGGAQRPIEVDGTGGVNVDI